MKRISAKFVEHRTVEYEMHQLYLDDRPIGNVVTAEKAVGLYYWLVSALPHLEKHVRAQDAKCESSDSVPSWLSGAPKKKSRKK